MARTVTLLQLRTDARLYADERPGGSSAFITDTELTRIINQELTSLYDMLVQARGQEYYMSTTPQSITITANTNVYTLASDLYQLVTAAIVWSTNEIEPLHTFEWQEESRFRNTAVTWGKFTPKGYRVVQDKILLYPVPSTTAGTIQVRYIPNFTNLSSDGDTFDGVNGWEEAVSLGAAAKMRGLQDLPAGWILERRAEVLDRIRTMAADRVTTEPKRLFDLGSEYYDGIYPRLPRP
jgi:hypothetical protein